MDENDKEWQDFLSKIDEYSQHSFEKWTTYTLLAYFLNSYKKLNEVDFIFSSNKRGPTKSRELKAASKIWTMFDKNRYKQLETKEDKLAYKEQLVNILKNYIDWAFKIKFHGRATNVTGLGIFMVSNFMNEFLQWRKLNKIVLPRRNDPLPSNFVSWINDNMPDIYKRQQLKVMEDLNSLKNIIEYKNLNKDTIENIVLEKSIELGIMPRQGKLELSKK